MALSLYDLAVLNRADEYTGLIEDVTNLAPEFSIIAAHPRKGTFYEVVKRTALPSATFRSVNAGVAPSQSTYKKEVKEMFLAEIQLKLDEAIVKADPQNVGALWQLEAAGAMQAFSILVGQQMYYGTSADAGGFTGVRNQLAATVAAGGTTNSTSAYLLNMDPQQGVRFDVGMDGSASISAPRLQTVTDPNDSTKVFAAYVGNLNCWLGYNQLSNLASWAVTGVDATHKFTDTNASQLVSAIPAARRGNLRWFINRSSEYYLTSSRTAIGYQAADAGGRAAFSPLANQCVGYPITVTDSVLDTETNS